MALNRRHDVRVEVSWKGRREFDPLHSRGSHRAQQATERRRALKSFQAAFCFRTITVHVLANQMNLFVAVAAKLAYLRDDVGGFPALFAAARIRHDAVSTKLVTTFD